MSIAIDGERSKARLPVGRKLLAQVKDLALIAKTIIVDGFFIKAVDFGSDLSKIIIKAPMGAVVAYSDATGIHVQTADWWLGAFSKKRKYKKFVEVPPGYQELSSWGSGAVENTEYTPGPAYYYTLYVPEATNYLARWCSPVITPVVGETVFFRVHGRMTDPFYDGRAGLYLGAGERLFGTVGDLVFSLTGGGTFSMASSFNQYLKPYGLVYEVQSNTAMFLPNDGVAQKPACCTVISIQKDVEGAVKSEDVIKVTASDGGMYLEYTWRFCDDVFSAMPSWLKTEIAAAGWHPLPASEFGVVPAGNYAWAWEGQVNFLNTYILVAPKLIGGTPAANGPFYEHQDDIVWAFAYVLEINTAEGTTKATINAGQMIALLNEVFPNFTPPGGTTEENYAYARGMFRALFVYPNVANMRGEVPDSTMFHGPDAVYSWARRRRTVKFSVAGLSLVDLSIPVEAMTTAGVRPDITYAGEGLYFCACVAPHEVVALYKGSPFGEWLVIPMPSTGKLLHVRPAKVVSDVGVTGQPPIIADILYGVVSIVEGAEEQTYFCSYTKGAWLRHGKLELKGSGTWEVAVFGEGSESLANYPSPPPLLRYAVPDMPYEKYAEDSPWLY